MVALCRLEGAFIVQVPIFRDRQWPGTEDTEIKEAQSWPCTSHSVPDKKCVSGYQGLEETVSVGTHLAANNRQL